MWSVVVVYAVATMIETSLHPFDLLECEPEIVSGYYVDHGSVGFMLIYLGEGISLLNAPICPSTYTGTWYHVSRDSECANTYISMRTTYHAMVR